MLVLFHVSAALLSIAVASGLLLKPVKKLFVINYGLIGLTIGSGTVLCISRHVPLLQACTTGLVYLAIVSGLVFAGSRRLAAETASEQ